MKTETKNFSRIQVAPSLKDNLKAVAASKHITLRSLTEQVLNRFIESRMQLLSEIAQNDKEGKS
jgi:fructose-1,6-bisphosphatase/sedoheptulose 1,7-bisphosphatase-like protein